MSGQRARLARLEAKARNLAGVELTGFFDADLSAGVWRDVHHGRTRPMTPEEIENVQQASEGGSAILMLGPLPGRSRKLVYGIRAADL